MPERFVCPSTGEPLSEQNGALVAAETPGVTVPIVNGIPRFVRPDEDYAEAFGFQWRTWHTLSDSLNEGSSKYEEIAERTHFCEYPTDGASILECGMGGGDDTEALLRFPFAEVHAFDLSSSVERAASYLSDPRLTISQASIYSIPYADESFDFAFCHRVLQHTPDPERALRCVCRKVRSGGVLFAHCYKRSAPHMRCFKYKYRWLTRRLPYQAIYWYVRSLGPLLHQLNRVLYRLGRFGRTFSHDWVPYYHYPHYRGLDQKRLRQLEQLNTFDALTPAFDKPMRTDTFLRVLREEGFVVEHLFDPPYSPIYATAVKRR